MSSRGSTCGARFTRAQQNLRNRKQGMTCYFRRLKQVFQKAGIEVTPQNRQEIDRIIHTLVGVDYKNCPAAWRQVKLRVLQDEVGFAKMLKEAWSNRK